MLPGCAESLDQDDAGRDSRRTADSLSEVEINMLKNPLAWVSDVCVHVWLRHLTNSSVDKSWFAFNLAFLVNLRDPTKVERACTWHKVDTVRFSHDSLLSFVLFSYQNIDFSTMKRIIMPVHSRCRAIFLWLASI